MAFGKRNNTKQYDNTDTGILWEVEFPESQRHPGYKGSLDVGGVDYWISGWDKDTKNGPAVRLVITRKDEARAESNTRQRESVSHGEQRRLDQHDDYPKRDEPPPPRSQDDYGEKWDENRDV